MRRIESVADIKCDVMVIDEAGSNFINYCLPDGCSVCVIKIRNVIPIIKSSTFLLNLVSYIFKYGLTSESLLSAIINSQKPKVVITFTDDFVVMGKLQTIFPEILVISVQNGIRTDDEVCFKDGGDFYSFPNYYGFGSYEQDLMKRCNASVKEYQAVGSLKMGVFLSHFYQSGQGGSDICFISSYKANMEESTSHPDKVFMSITKDLCRLIYRYSQESEASVTIAMRNNINDKDYESELSFYRNYFKSGTLKISPNNHDKLSSYKIGMDSNIIISLDSSLSFELFGAGKKVLFCANASSKFKYIRNVTQQLDHLPPEYLLDDLTYVGFVNKMDNLLKISSEHMAKFKESRKYYMNLLEIPPHQIIKKRIHAKCQKL